jgi:hypothetical protein
MIFDFERLKALAADRLRQTDCTTQELALYVADKEAVQLSSGMSINVLDARGRVVASFKGT